MLRFTFLVIFLISFLILSIPVLLVEAIIGKFNRKAKITAVFALSSGDFVVFYGSPE